MKKLSLILCLLVLAPIALAACGDDEDESSDSTVATTETEATAPTEGGSGGDAGGGGTVAISANPDGELAYEETEASAPAGPVTIEFDNPASLGHDVVVEDSEGNELARTDVISGETTSAEAELAAGTYTFYCSVGSHREAGMEGTLTAE